MKDEFRRKTMSNNKGWFSGTYRNVDLYPSKRLNELERKEKRRARRSMKQELKRMSIDEW